MKHPFRWALLLLPVVVGVGVMIGLMAGRSGMTTVPSPPVASDTAHTYSDQVAKDETPLVVHSVAQPIAVTPVTQSEGSPAAIEEAGIYRQTNVPPMTEQDYYQMAETNAAEAVKLAHSLDPTNRSNGMMENLVQKWAGADLTSAGDWVESQTKGEERDRLLERVAFVQGDTDPKQALEMVANKISPGPIQDEAAMTVLHQELEQDFYTGSSWWNLFPEGPLQKRAQQEIAGWALYQQDLSGGGGK